MTATIIIKRAQKHTGPEAGVASPLGLMRCRPGDWIVTDLRGGQWVFTEDQLRAIAQPPRSAGLPAWSQN